MKKKPFSPIPPARFRPAGPVGPAGHHPSPPPLSHPLTGRARLSASSPPNRFSPPLSQFSNRSRPSRSHVPHSSPPRLGFLWRSSAPEPPSPSPHFASLAPATLAAHRKPSPATSARAIRELDRPRRFRCVGELPPPLLRNLLGHFPGARVLPSPLAMLAGELHGRRPWSAPLGPFLDRVLARGGLACVCSPSRCSQI